MLIAASGTGGHLFPALAVAQKLSDYEIQWLGVPNRLETSLVPDFYPLHTVNIDGFQTRLGVKTIFLFAKMLGAIAFTYKLIKREKIDLVFTTGGYISAPAILGAKLAKVPVILHESNYIPGKVTKLLGKQCNLVALGFEGTKKYLPKTKTQWVSTPVRQEFLSPNPLDFKIPPNVPVIVAMGGSQGAVALNRLVRQCAPRWLKNGWYIVHLTGNRDDDFGTFEHPNYIEMTFYDNMAGLLNRADFAISRSGASALTELAITKTPSVLIPFPFAAEDHQFFNAQVFTEANAGIVFRQDDLTPEILDKTVTNLIKDKIKLREMAGNCQKLALFDSADILARIIRSLG
nr:undecaprenyldiphospho-muramoylpentapeptide beta-N-acetylglucosaminyltransferase [Cyanobacterium stanieri]